MEQLFPVHRPDLEPEHIYDDLELPPAYHDRPYVAVNMVSSIDGKITIDQSHQEQKLGSPLDRQLMMSIRAHFDGVLRGAGTVRANPAAPKLPDKLVAMRRQREMRDHPLFIVASRSLNLPLTDNYGDHRVIVLTTAASDAYERDRLRQWAEVEVVGNDDLDVDHALGVLRERYGIQRLLVEGGAALNYAFIRANVLDSLFWTLAPKVVGNKKDLTMVEGPGLLRPIPRLSLRTLFHHESELFFHWSTSR